MSGLYTNTGKVQSVIGLIITTVAVAYATTNSTKIVDSTVELAKKGFGKVKAMVVCKEKHEYILCAKDYDGKIYDTGRRIWR